MTDEDFAERVGGRLERLELSPEEAAAAAGLPAALLRRVLSGEAPVPRGRTLLRLAEVLSTSASYLVGLDPDAPLPPELLGEDQGSLGLLAGDEEALLRAYRRLDVSSRAALLQVTLRMAPEPETVERPARQMTPARAGRGQGGERTG